MGLVSILTDEELIHYAGIDEDAQAEMALRSASFSGTYLSEIEDLKLNISVLESRLSTAEDDSLSADELQDCISRVHDILKNHRDMSGSEALEAIEHAINEMADFTR